MDFEFLLYDRVEKIKQIINKYGADNFYISYSGGKDSVVLSALVDMAITNDIPRVYVNTGIDLNMVRDFVFKQKKNDKRIEVIVPKLPIRQTLDKYGWPFKSKRHSITVGRYQKSGVLTTYQKKYVAGKTYQKCPTKLIYQFTSECHLKISHQCCVKLKEEPLAEWGKEHNKTLAMVGIMRDEGGQRYDSQCLVFDKKGDLKRFQPLAPITKEWEEWFIEKYNIEICDIYKPPYSQERTGCKGCPFGKNLQAELDMLEKYFPAERKQCELIWGPVYEEYRRLGYRLKQNELEGQMTIDDYLKGNN